MVSASLARPHLPAFVRFERWVHRALTAGLDFDGRGSLSEAVFAPIRRDWTVAGAWVEAARHPGRPLALVDNSRPPQSLRWRRLKDPGGGEFEVARMQGCPTREPGSGRALAPECVFVSRVLRPSQGEQTRVTVVFLPEHPGDS